MHILGRIGRTREMSVRHCTTFYVTLAESTQPSISYTLRNADISFDHAKERLALEIRQV